MSPFRLKFDGDCVTPIEKLREHAVLTRHYPRVKFHSKSGKLAVCGGAPSLAHAVKELRSWDGDIWGINYTAAWLIERGVDAAFYTVDGDPNGSIRAPTAKKAILASWCAPDTFESLKDAEVEVFDMKETHKDGLNCGSSSASSAPILALTMGYREVHYFGCEGSFLGADHVDRDECAAHQLIVRAGGVDYITRPPLYVQCQEIATLCREVPHVFKNHSGGLLQAMIDHPDSWEVVGVSAALKEHLEAVNGKQGMYDSAYKPPEVA